MRLRTGLLLGIVALVAALAGATAFAVGLVVDRADERRVRGDLDRSHALFEALLRARAAMDRANCGVVSNEPRLRAVVATQDISRDTISGVITELRASLGSDLLVLTDAAGTLIADAADPAASGASLGHLPGIAAARERGDGSAVWITADRPYQVSACRIDLGADSVGIIAVGRALDDAVAEAVRAQTGSTLILALDGRPVAASALPGGAPAGAEPVPALGATPTTLVRGGDRYLARGGPLSGYTGKRALTYAMLRSLDEALAPGRELRRALLAIAGVALAIALAVALVLARRLSGPVAALVRVTRAIGRGDLTARATPGGASEVRALAHSMNTMVEELASSRTQLAEKQRLERELEIAARIQTSILPRRLAVPGLEIAAQMVPASEVGGDYYDVYPTPDGAWIGIGDVAGHGLPAGLEMLMVQSVVAALVRRAPTASPAEHIAVANQVLYENIRERLQQDEHITLTLLRYTPGLLTFAGAHEELLVCRAAGGPIERIPTPGTWLGAVPEIDRVTRDSQLALAPGDLVVLYTDGLTEARAAAPPPGAGARRAGQQFGDAQLLAVLEEVRGEAPEVVRDRLVAAARAWQPVLEDDLTVVVIRRRAD